MSGPDIPTLRAKALDLANLVAEYPNPDAPTFDWNESGKVVKVEVGQDKARQLGISSSDIASILNGIVGGTTITQVRDSIYLVDVAAWAAADERHRIERRSKPCRSQRATARSCRCCPSRRYACITGGIVWGVVPLTTRIVGHAGMEDHLDLTGIGGPQLGVRPIEADQEAAANPVDFDDELPVCPTRQ